MASVFSYDPDPPRVTSPWSRQSAAPSQSERSAPSTLCNLHSNDVIDETGGTNITLAQIAVTHLEAEPQDGPTEYKLHLLLRPRRFFPASTARKNTPSSQHGGPDLLPSKTVQENTVSHYSSPAVQSGSSSRQHRLEQLTTQLLWRLQQSSPYHSSSATNVILPSLPDASKDLRPPPRLAKPPPGLEESNGALYEIGVADDGTFVGLTTEEMEESLNNLRAMAASLGCSVQVLRMVNIGEQQWLEHAREANQAPKALNVKLFVAEAYIKPELQSQETLSQESARSRKISGPLKEHEVVDNSSVEQIRISLTGATTCGKSSLLGTLSTSTLDNGRGKSRLSLLKHRHEIASGVTSSVVQELIGYSYDAFNQRLSVVNYAAGNVSSWTDIHASSATARLAFISDSAGHPRYMRTTIRSLMSCAPHWTLLCVAANAGTPQQQEHLPCPEPATPPFTGATAHLSMAHLDICLRLNLPLIIVVTKFDAATKSSFRQILSTILTVLKSAGRQPVMIPGDNGVSSDTELQDISKQDYDEAEKIAASLASDSRMVPILFTSAIRGIGIRKLHAMLRCLPITPMSNVLNGHEAEASSSDDTPDPLFHVDDVFTFPPSKATDIAVESANISSSTPGSVVSGYLARGEISIGDELFLGPFSQSIGSEQEGSEANTIPLSGPDDPFLTPRSYNDAIAKATSSPKVRVVPPEREWRRCKVVSVRNLRLPVRKLESDQVGTLGILPIDGSFAERRQLPIRKGMILARGTANRPPAAAHTFTAAFDIAEASALVMGSFVVVYCASVRASAKVIAIALEKRHAGGSRRSASNQKDDNGSEEEDSKNRNSDDEDDDTFGFHMDGELSSRSGHNERYIEERDDLALSRSASPEQERAEAVLITLQLVTYREWLETGSQVLVITGGGPGQQSASERRVKGLAGLEGLVGTVVEKFG